ncbi:LuxR family transcriptional regulator (plasmid) [Sinomonas atrocyanea]|uniref:LuxR family transcriptional regulator n=1 Tax=Sinomonas atrocyanea TaxID=37927 RepID=A0A127A5J2_9MICC|nr:response regulator [Sinomonas atrocyanea]AMM34758.1 LuxR family transcriptional regulator [Sinomonas atrocyanea]GEB66241.1 DNA-binding response regulator [Sinomonas atrocyanea]GGG80114.1 DNA-binding response regulator [Sinomonas atrocyanea]
MPLPPAGTRAAISVFILSSHDLLRRTLSELLGEEGFDIVGEEGTVAAAVPAAARTAPHVALLSNRLTDGTGIEACRALREAAPRTRCIILTTYDEQKALRSAALAGAAGYLLQSPRAPRLIDAIRRVAAGEQLHAPEAARAVLQSPSTCALLKGATEHERAVWSLIVQGRTNTEIRNQLALTPEAFCACLSALLAKLGYRPAPHAVGPANPS